MKQKRPTRSGSRSETGLDQGGHLQVTTLLGGLKLPGEEGQR